MAQETGVQSQVRVISKTQKMVLDAFLLSTQYYKVRERSSALPYTFG